MTNYSLSSRKKLLLSTLCFSLASTGSLCSSPALAQNQEEIISDLRILNSEKSGKALKVRALELFEKRRFSEALAFFHRAENTSDAPEDIQYWLARTYAFLGKEELSRQALEKMLAIDANHGESILLRGILESAKKRNDRALADLSRAIELLPGSSDAWYHRARVKSERGEYLSALVDLDRAIELGAKENDLQMLDFKTRLLVYADRYQDAASVLQIASRIDPGRPELLFKRAKLLYRCGDISGALEVLDAYLESRPDDNLAMRAKARCLLESRRADEALKIYDYLVTKNMPGKSGLLRMRAQSLRLLGREEEALVDESRASSIDKSAAKSRVNKKIWF